MKISEERARDFGEVLTPEWVVADMLPSTLIQSSLAGEGKFLDLCSGPGAFITHVLKEQLNNLSDREDKVAVLNILSNLYGIELLEDNVDTCYELMLEIVSNHFSNSKMDIFFITTVSNILQENLIHADVLTEEILVPVREPWITVAQSNRAVLTPISEVHFNIIASNPPYQKNISGSTTGSRLRNHSKATPVYHKFFDYARNLNPDYISFIMPAKWYTGGWGLDKWRVSVLQDTRIEKLVDYRDSHTIFPTTEVNGGICWLLWNGQHAGDALVTRYDREGELIASMKRPLLEEGANFFVRDEQALSILRKVKSFQLSEEESFTSQILGTTPYGFASNFKDYSETKTADKNIKLFYIKLKEYWVSRSQVTANRDQVKGWKIFLSLSYNQHSKQIIGVPHIYGPNTVCTHSYLSIVGFAGKKEAENCTSYMRTKFFRFLAGQLKISPIATRQVYRLIPRQDWGKTWTDEELYKKYGFTSEEIEYIGNKISNM